MMGGMGYGMHGYPYGFGTPYGFGMEYYGLGFLWQIFWLAVIIAVIYFLLNSLSWNKSKEGKSVQILKERLARGEISEEEFAKLREILEK